MWKRLLVFTFAISFIFTGCRGNKKDYINEKISTDDSKNYNEKRKFSVWTTYWDTSNLENEFDRIEYSIENISYFAAYFDEKKNLFIPKETKKTYEIVKSNYSENNYGSYLSFVNDLLRKNESSSLKDTDLLYDLFKSEESMNNHIKEILDMTLDGGYDGIEIDYEGMNQDILLWNLFIDFVDKLNIQANEQDIGLRILLEPNFPVGLLKFPQGPEYVMMCYNLHGYGTSPGPKANKEFILEMIKKMEKLPGNINFAMPTGGFKFYEGGVESLSEKEAVELSMVYNASTIRDENSKAISFTYMDEEGISYEVWYADAETLDFWFSLVEGAGDYGLSLWRMGGNLTIIK